MDFFTSDVLTTGTDRRPGRDLTARFLGRGHGVHAGARTPTGSTEEGRHGRGGCADL
ncbi:hypothetical protein SALBM311S_05543 [Streptomyces alboniger]